MLLQEKTKLKLKESTEGFAKYDKSFDESILKIMNLEFSSYQFVITEIC